MTIHVVGLPHTPFDVVEARACAFTAKTVRFTRMLRTLGRDFTVYWGGSSTPEPVDYVSVYSDAEQVAHFGKFDPAKLPVVNWDVNLTYWKLFNGRIIKAISEKIQPDDIIAVVGGGIHQEIVDAFPNHVRIEPGAGYEGICRDTFVCFESYAWMHDRYGANHIGNGRAFDAVIPNAVDPAEFTPGESHGYALYVGRLIQRKGPNAASDIAKAAGLPLKVAGAGVKTYEDGVIVTTDGTVVRGEYVGVMTGEPLAELFRHAEVFICPTLYIGPWEGVHAESLMASVGVVAPDYGVFTETLPRELRYRHLSEAVQCIETARGMRGSFREDAIKKFSIATCTEMYEEWFKRLELLKGKGWYS